MGTVTLRWIEKTFMVGTDSNGHSVAIGRSPEDHSQFHGLKPSDLLLLAAASCAAYDVVEILAKQREPLRDLKVICSGEQDADPPYTFNQIRLHYVVSGPVSPRNLNRAITLSEEKYCSVIASLKPQVPVACDYEIIE